MSSIERVMSESEKVGKLLKRKREELGGTQKEIARVMDYKSANYVSMLETGSSKIPFTKIPEITRAYCLDRLYIVIIIRQLYPEHWNLIKELMRAVPELDAIVHETLEKDVAEMYDEALDEYLKY